MKFLVLALCVCAVSAASFGSSPFGAGGYKAYKGFQNTVAAPAVVAANVVAAPAVVAAKAVASVAAPVVTAPVAAAGAATYEAGAATYEAGAATYQAGSNTYQAAKQVVNKAYGSEGEAAILRSESDVSSDGYKYSFETANGISSEAVGAYKQIGEAGAVVSQGAFRYTSPDGTPVIFTYTADENGYQPQSDSLPVGPEIPEAIARSLVYIAARSKDAVQKY